MKSNFSPWETEALSALYGTAQDVIKDNVNIIIQNYSIWESVHSLKASDRPAGAATVWFRGTSEFSPR